MDAKIERTLGHDTYAYRLYEQLETAKKASREALVREIAIRDELVVHLHGRWAYARKRIGRLLGCGESFMAKEITRLRQEGRIG